MDRRLSNGINLSFAASYKQDGQRRPILYVTSHNEKLPTPLVATIKSSLSAGRSQGVSMRLTALPVADSVAENLIISEINLSKSISSKDIPAAVLAETT